MQKYTVGLLFSEDLKTVILINKRRPEWQIGKLNGIGGHIEENEKPQDCMTREFKEETGVEIRDWSLFATLTDTEKWLVYFFRSVVSNDLISRCQTQTDEEVIQISLRDPLPENTIENLKWMIPLALSKDHNKYKERKNEKT